MKLFTKIFPVVIFGLMSISCQEHSYFAFDRTTQVKSFPIVYKLGSPDTLEIGAVGIQGIEVFKDFIMVSSFDSAGCLSVYTKDGKPVSNPFLKIGRCPGEVMFRPFMSWFSFRENSAGEMLAGLFDFKGNYMEYNINQSMESGAASWKCLADSLPVSYGARYFSAGDGTLICRKKNNEDSGYERFLTDCSGKVLCPPAMTYLNSFSAAESNLLSTLILVNTDRKIVAELGSRLSVIHLYSLSEDFMSTVMTGKRPEDLQEIGTLSPEDMPKAYYEAKGYDDFFAALYLGTTVGDLNEGRVPEPQLQIFVWDGTPVASVPLPVGTMYFDIDIYEGRLYIVDGMTEKLLSYDVSGILSAVNGRK